MHAQRQSDTDTDRERETNAERHGETDAETQRRDTAGIQVKGSYLEMDRQGARQGKKYGQTDNRQRGWR